MGLRVRRNTWRTYTSNAENRLMRHGRRTLVMLRYEFVRRLRGEDDLKGKLPVMLLKRKAQRSPRHRHAQSSQILLYLDRHPLPKTLRSLGYAE